MKILLAKNNGFTIIELLVSVAIVGILSSIALSEFNNYKEKSYEVIIKNQIANARLAIETKITDSIDQILPTSVVFLYGDGSEHLPSSSLSSADLMPGYVHQDGSFLIVALTNADSKYRYTIQGAHCKGSSTNGFAKTFTTFSSQGDIGFTVAGKIYSNPTNFALSGMRCNS